MSTKNTHVSKPQKKRNVHIDKKKGKKNKGC